MKEDRIFYSPIAVFYLDHKRTLMPLFIQLTRSTEFENEIFIAPNVDKATNKATAYQVLLEKSAMNV